MKAQHDSRTLKFGKLTFFSPFAHLTKHEIDQFIHSPEGRICSEFDICGGYVKVRNCDT